jgi:hypothetical protein
MATVLFPTYSIQIHSTYCHFNYNYYYYYYYYYYYQQ